MKKQVFTKYILDRSARFGNSGEATQRKEVQNYNLNNKQK